MAESIGFILGEYTIPAHLPIIYITDSNNARTLQRRVRHINNYTHRQRVRQIKQGTSGHQKTNSHTIHSGCTPKGRNYAGPGPSFHTNRPDPLRTTYTSTPIIAALQMIYPLLTPPYPLHQIYSLLQPLPITPDHISTHPCMTS